ncbi:hypothetical protein Clacol_001155 [Clathrus columnatus]|uniref:PPIase cyclophilin-type domain-containing protein n=1 Tax=Clathrus columnatus TaxID=1419009 RepID=A0AAV5A2V0_9AGAM|nr:hypothetical protein Clacol_001155 [Clathrus columnatus]
MFQLMKVLFFIYWKTVSKDFLAQTGDPTTTGMGGQCVNAIINPNTPRYFVPELIPNLKHVQRGTVSMAVAPGINGKFTGGSTSQFFITLDNNIEYLDGKHAVFGHIVEGFDMLDKLNEVYTDSEGRPIKDVRIHHIVILGRFNFSSAWFWILEQKTVLDDPFTDPEGLVVPDEEPNKIPNDPNLVRIAEDEELFDDLPEEEAEQQR